MRQVTREDCDIEVIATHDDTEVRGNASASGDDAEDRAAEDAILARSSVWAWASVEVRLTLKGTELTASEHLSCCSYRDEKDFRAPGGYFDDMVNECLSRLNANVATISRALAPMKRQDA